MQNQPQTQTLRNLITVDAYGRERTIEAGVRVDAQISASGGPAYCVVTAIVPGAAGFPTTVELEVLGPDDTRTGNMAIVWPSQITAVLTNYRL